MVIVQEKTRYISSMSWTLKAQRFTLITKINHAIPNGVRLALQYAALPGAVGWPSPAALYVL